jgi:protein-disulfide isomerase
MNILKNPWVLIGGFAVLLFVGAFVLADQAQEANNAGIEDIVHVKGNPDADVTFVKYSDFQCSACAQAYPVVSSIVDEYGDKLRFEYRHFPIERIHPYAVQAAMAAEAAGQQGKFYEFHDLLFENQQVWANSPTPNVLFTEYAEQLGLDIDQFERQARASVLRDKARAQFAEGRDAGVTGTPAFFLNGEQLRGENGGPLSYPEVIARVAEVVGEPLPEVAEPATEGVGEADGGGEEGVRFGL